MLNTHFHKVSTVWHEIFAGVYAGGLAIFWVLRELIFCDQYSIVYFFVSEWKRQVVIEQTRFLSTVF